MKEISGKLNTGEKNLQVWNGKRLVYPKVIKKKFMDKEVTFGDTLIFLQEKENIIAGEQEDIIEVKRFSSILEVDKHSWDSVNSSIFNSYDFLRSIEESNIEDSKLYYLLFSYAGRIIGTAVLSSFTVSLDLLAGYSFQRFVNYIRKYFPSFLRLRFLFCGTPISIGKNNLCLSKLEFIDSIIDLLNCEMTRIVKNESINMLCIKELNENESIGYCGFIKYGFFRADTIPYMSLNIKWRSFNSYLNSMRYNFRRQIKDGLKKIKVKEPDIYLNSDKKPDHAYLLLMNASEISPDKFHSLYLQVMKRAKNKLEVLNKEFFKKLFSIMDPEPEVLSLMVGNELLGSAIITSEKDKMTFLLVGFDQREVRRYDTYFNLVYGIISLAIRRGCRVLDMGQTSYYFKQRCGAVPSDRYMYIKSENRLIHILIKTFRNLIFPKLVLPEYNVFRNVHGQMSTGELEGKADPIAKPV